VRAKSKEDGRTAGNKRLELRTVGATGRSPSEELSVRPKNRW